MNINSAIIQGAKFLKDSFINNPYLDSEILMAKAIEKDRKYILLNSEGLSRTKYPSHLYKEK